MPRPRRNSSRPSSRSSRSARSTVLVLTPRTAARSFAGGRRSPGFASPSAIARRISPATCSYRSVGSALSTLTFSMVLVTLSQSCRTCSCDRHRPASPAPPGRSRRPRGARGPRRGADRGGEDSAPGAGGASTGLPRRWWRSSGSRCSRSSSAAHSRRLLPLRSPHGPAFPPERQARSSLSSGHRHSACCGRGPHRALRDERRRKRAAEADARRVRGGCLVARRAEDRLPT